LSALLNSTPTCKVSSIKNLISKTILNSKHSWLISWSTQLIFQHNLKQEL
jgi:hypothetical protein